MARGSAIGQTARVIRNVVIHQTGQLPLVADLKALPTGGDVNLVCTNVRTADGKRPTFIDDRDNWFVIPLVTVRFLEVPRASMTESGEIEAEPEMPVEEEQPVVDEVPTEPDPDLLARIRNI
jgi:hypothetical protein